MECIYCFDYVDKKFFGWVMAQDGNTVFEIEDTEHMCNLIESGEMDHIDDVRGLETLLKHDKILDENDFITFGGIA